MGNMTLILKKWNQFIVYYLLIVIVCQVIATLFKDLVNQSEIEYLFILISHLS